MVVAPAGSVRAWHSTSWLAVVSAAEAPAPALDQHVPHEQPYAHAPWRGIGLHDPEGFPRSGEHVAQVIRGRDPEPVSLRQLPLAVAVDVGEGRLPESNIAADVVVPGGQVGVDLVVVAVGLE